MTGGYWDHRTCSWQGREPEHVVPPAWRRTVAAAGSAAAEVPEQASPQAAEQRLTPLAAATAGDRA